MAMEILFSLIGIGVVALFLRLYNALVAKPEKLRCILRKQGISGPPPTVVLGNVLEIKKYRSANSNAPAVVCGGVPKEHNCARHLFGFFEPWQDKYGELSFPFLPLPSPKKKNSFSLPF